MNHSETIAEISLALCAAQAKMPRVQFDAQNPFLKNKYASLGAVIEASRPILSENGLAICQLPFSFNGTIGVESVLVHKSGQWISHSLSLDLGDEKGKSRAQVAGSIITYFRRYAWASILGLYADEDTDGHHGEGSKTVPKASKPSMAARTTSPESGKVESTSPTNQNASDGPSSAKSATESTRNWALGQLNALPGEPARDIVSEFFTKAGALLRDLEGGGGEQLEDLPLEYVPTSKAELADLVKAIGAFEAGEEAKMPYKHPMQCPIPDDFREATEAAAEAKKHYAKAFEAQSPNPEEAERAVDPSWEIAEGIVEHVSLKEGDNAKGHWTRYGIKIEGTWYSTFSKRIGQVAWEAWKAERQVTLYFTEGAKGKDAEEIE